MVDIGIRGGKFCVMQIIRDSPPHQLSLACSVAAEGEEQDGENVSAARHAEENVVKKENERDVEEGGPSAERDEDNMFCSTFPKVEQK